MVLGRIEGACPSCKAERRCCMFSLCFLDLFYENSRNTNKINQDNYGSKAGITQHYFPGLTIVALQLTRHFFPLKKCIYSCNQVLPNWYLAVEKNGMEFLFFLICF